jgi:hypothetical protein
MPVPEDVIGAWSCSPNPDGRPCKAEWVSCDECDGEEGQDDKCSNCTGSGGGYICGTHDIEPTSANPAVEPASAQGEMK